MIYATYDLSTLKHHAKQLKRLGLEHGVSWTSMEALDLVAQSLNADNWNMLYKSHADAMDALRQELYHGLEVSRVVLIEDLSVLRKIKLFTEMMQRLSEKGVADEIIESYAGKISSVYTPTFSQHFLSDLKENTEHLRQKYTSLEDMYGSMLVASSSMSLHTEFLKKEVIPVALERGGTLFLEETQYLACAPLLIDKRVRVLYAHDNQISTPLEWVPGVRDDLLPAFFCPEISGWSGSMQSGRAFAYCSHILSIWREIGTRTIPVNSTVDFSPGTMSRMLDMLKPDSQVKINATAFMAHQGVDVSVKNWVNTLCATQQEFFGYAALVQDQRLSAFKADDVGAAVSINTLFDDLSLVTVVVLSKPEQRMGAGQRLVENSFAMGIVRLLRARLLEARREKILHGTPFVKHLVYTAPNSHAVQSVHAHFWRSPFISTVKPIASLLAEPVDKNGFRLKAEDIQWPQNMPESFEEIEYAIIKEMSDHLVDLKLVSQRV